MKIFFNAIQALSSVIIKIHKVPLKLRYLSVDLLFERELRESLSLVVLLAFKLVEPLVLGLDRLSGLCKAIV